MHLIVNNYITTLANRKDKYIFLTFFVFSLKYNFLGKKLYN